MAVTVSYPWAVLVTGSPLDGHRQFLAGPFFFGGALMPQKTALFFTRREARKALTDWKKKSAWAFTGKYAGHGGDRIYRCATVCRVQVTIQSERSV